jgi:nucleoside phosphorylase
MAMPLTHAEDLRLNYNPRDPQPRFLADLAPESKMSVSDRVAKPVPWPAATAPKAQPLKPAPNETDDLSKFAGYDAIVMTYTAAEADTLATLCTPDYPVSSWYEYRHNIAEYIPLVTGKEAPFNSTQNGNERYYHSLGLYFPCTIGKARVLLVKSGLHMDHDSETVTPGMVIPYSKMLTEMIQTVNPKVFITTGTGGGIGSDVKLGDVIIAGKTVFNCEGQFKNEKWHNASYATTPVSSKALALMTPTLLKVNAANVAKATPIPGLTEPKIWSGAAGTIVTTDRFAFDTSSNQPYQLQGLGQACEMGDAMVGQVMQGFKTKSWYAIRNASDPQMPVPPSKGFGSVDSESNYIYITYGALTTAASVIASWAIVASTFN